MRRFAGMLAVLLAVGLAGVPRAALAEDHAHLELTEITLTPASVDVSDSEQVVAVEARVGEPSADTLVDVTVVSPERRSQAWVTLRPATEADGAVVFRGDLRIARYVEAGTWHVDHVTVRESWDSERYYDRAALEEAGLARTLDVVSPVEDTTPPEVVELVTSPSHVMLAEGQDHAWATIRVRIIDDISGVHGSFWIAYRQYASWNQLRVSDFQRVSGDALDGIYEARAHIDTATQTGPYWGRPVFLRDAAGNNTGGWTEDRPPIGAHSDLHVGPATPPSQPRDVGARAGDTSAHVSWTPPRFDGTRAISGYEITASPGGTTVTAPPDASSAVVDGLTNGTAYTFDVVARNDVGTSQASRSRAVRATATPGAPDVTAPAVTSLDLVDTTFHVGDHDGWKTLTFAVGFTDDISGWYTKPGDDFVSRIMLVDPNGEAATGHADWRPRSGHELEGAYDFLVHLPPGAPEGSYTVTNLQLGDEAGNVADYPREYLAGAGHPTTFDVYRPRPPGSVRDLTAIASPGAIALGWRPPSDDGHSPITRYDVHRDGALVAELGAGATAWTDSDIPAGATLTYVVTAVNDAGAGEPAETTIMALGRPSAPQDLTGETRAGAAMLRWAPGDDGGSALTGYEVHRDGEVVATLAPDTTTFTDEGLAAATEYAYAVVATNAVGTSDAAELRVVTPSPPSRPRDVVAHPEPGAARISWAAPAADGGSVLTGYEVYRDGELITVLAPDATTFTDQGLAPATEYSYAVVATNEVGRSPAAEFSVLTPATPSAPQNVTARGGSGIGEIVTSWEPPASEGRSPILGYQLFRDGDLIAELPGDATSYTDSGRSVFQVSQYTVAAVNAVGVGAQSSSSCSAPSPWPAAVSAQLCAQTRSTAR